MLRLAFDFIITWRETRTRPNAYICRVYPAHRNRGDGIFARHHRALQGR